MSSSFHAFDPAEKEKSAAMECPEAFHLIFKNIGAHLCEDKKKTVPVREQPITSILTGQPICCFIFTSYYIIAIF